MCIRDRANPTYAKLVTEAIGDGWLDDARELEKLTAFEGDASFLCLLYTSRCV